LNGNFSGPRRRSITSHASNKFTINRTDQNPASWSANPKSRLKISASAPSTSSETAGNVLSMPFRNTTKILHPSPLNTARAISQPGPKTARQLNPQHNARHHLRRAVPVQRSTTTLAKISNPPPRATPHPMPRLHQQYSAAIPHARKIPRNVCSSALFDLSAQWQVV